MRSFTKTQKLAAQIASGREGEADHIKPFSKGGETTIENCQIISSSMNKRKSNFLFEPREWQASFLLEWEKRRDGSPFMLIAIPGSGKTMASLEAARRWMAAGADRRLVVVVPSDNLRKQWQDEATQFGIDLQTKDFGTNFKHGYQGGVVTYHLVASQPLVFRALCAAAPTMVIFDEIHHCGEDSHFGTGIKSAFELAKEKLLMSGTPWKSDGKPIPFVRYDGGGYAIGDFRYDYPHALSDGVVRYLVFDHAKGTVTNDVTGEEGEISADISDADAAKRLRNLLEPGGDYVRRQIEDAHRKLQECRRTVSDAGAMAVCIDQWHAVKVAKVIREVTGVEPSVIVSDSSMENDSVKSFRNSSKEWLVSVRKVSEGTDIKRLQVLCYLTNVTAELFFRQVIGRVSRVRDMEDYEGYVYLPADPRLIAAAKNIENAQVMALKESAEKEARELSSGESNIDDASWSTRHDGTDIVLIGSAKVPIAEYREIERIAAATGLAMQKVMEVRMLSGQPLQPVRESNESREVNREDYEKALRKKCNDKAFRLSRLLGIEVQQVHKQFKPQSSMSIQELEAKLASILKQIQEA